MPSNKNIQALADLKDKLASAKSVVFADYHGLSVSQMQDLRAKVKETAGQLLVTKNTLLKLALKDKHGNKLNDALKGPTALLIATEDEIGPLKALVGFAQEFDLPKVKAGVLEDRILSPEEIAELAKLPGRMELQAKLVATLNAPRTGLVTVLSGNFRQLIFALKAIQESKSEGGEKNE